ncbi:MAG: hypothetical protein JWM89_1312 [Acidimicrobiales bacterium]|nr:hypothetical protein [Acidimicrobiales bacterium]
MVLAVGGVLVGCGGRSNDVTSASGGSMINLQFEDASEGELDANELAEGLDLMGRLAGGADFDVVVSGRFERTVARLEGSAFGSERPGGMVGAKTLAGLDGRSVVVVPSQLLEPGSEMAALVPGGRPARILGHEGGHVAMNWRHEGLEDVKAGWSLDDSVVRVAARGALVAIEEFRNERALWSSGWPGSYQAALLQLIADLNRTIDGIRTGRGSQREGAGLSELIHKVVEMSGYVAGERVGTNSDLVGDPTLTNWADLQPGWHRLLTALFDVPDSTIPVSLWVLRTTALELAEVTLGWLRSLGVEFVRLPGGQVGLEFK